MVSREQERGKIVAGVTSVAGDIHTIRIGDPEIEGIRSEKNTVDV